MGNNRIFNYNPNENKSKEKDAENSFPINANSEEDMIPYYLRLVPSPLPQRPYIGKLED